MSTTSTAPGKDTIFPFHPALSCTNAADDMPACGAAPFPLRTDPHHAPRAFPELIPTPRPYPHPQAIAWSPHQHGLLASGGGTADRCIRFWNTANGTALQSVDTGSQVGRGGGNRLLVKCVLWVEGPVA